MDTGVQTTANEVIGLLDELDGLLKRQIELAHQGDAAGEQFNVLTAKAGAVVEEIARFGASGSGRFQHRFTKLRKLYETLSLVVAAEKADVAEDLSRIRRGRKIIGTYRRNI